MSEGYEGRRRGRGISTDSRRTAIKKKEGKEMGEKREERADAFSPENMSYLRDEGGGRRRRGGGAGGTEGGETGVLLLLLTTAKLSPTTHGHFSGTFLQVRVQKELAGGVVSLFPM